MYKSKKPKKKKYSTVDALRRMREEELKRLKEGYRANKKLDKEICEDFKHTLFNGL